MPKEPLLQKSSSLPCLILLLLSCLSHPCHSQNSGCKEAVDSVGSVYSLEAQLPGDSRVCQPDSAVFTKGGVRYCFALRAQGGVFTELTCSGDVQPPKPRQECKDQLCQQFSKALKESMDLSAQPCDDFYKFACGKDSGNNALGDGEDLFMTRMQEILKDPSKLKSGATGTKLQVP